MQLTKDSIETIAFEDVKKDDRTYSVKFADKISLQTGRSTMMSPSIVDADNDIVPFLQVTLDAKTADVLRTFEAFIKKTTKTKKVEWFKKAISDAYLESSFKTNFKDAPAQAASFKVAEDFALFDAQGTVVDPAALVQGTDVVLLLEATRITFGKTEYGCLWKVRQGVLLPPKPKPECLIQVTDDEATAAPEDDDDDYFL